MNLTHKLGNLRAENIGEEVKIAGWVAKQRNLGDLIFIDLRDRSGIVQIVAESGSEVFDKLAQVKKEYVLEIKGKVRKRSNVNDKIPTGEIEIVADSVYVVNKSKQTPMLIEEETDALEDTRLVYRYLDLRRPNLYRNLKLRHQIALSIRNFLNDQDFLEIETPILTKSTPEGARDYLVPSRVNPEMMYALPQSPQIYKNLLMIGGIERYYQIAKCFRDEDLRADRQPEFTQVDLEMSFMSEEEIRNLTEQMIKKVVSDTKGIEIEEAFPIMEYDVAMDKYGNDKPDIRFELFLNNVTSLFANSEFQVFKNAEMIKMIKLENKADVYSRKEIDKLEALCKKNHAKGLAWLKMEDTLTGPIAKFLSEEEIANLIKEYDLKANDILFFVADSQEVVNQALSALRNHLGKEWEMYNEEELAFVWVVNWPMFEYDEELGRYFAMHHPFTMPVNNEFSEDTINTRAQAYDIVLNGYELGGGSIRINNNELQMEMFGKLGISEEEAEEEFGFLLEAYQYGAPYHGGIALGLDRFAMILANGESIRDVIAFPKNAKAREVMLNSPSVVDDKQMEELNISWRDNEK